MADATSALLQLLLQETGNNDNTWGVLLNQGLQKLEDAIAGRNLTETFGGTTTLTDNQARYAVQKVSGLLTENAVIVVPTRYKSWLFVNVTTGAFTVTVKTASGTGVVLPANTYALLVCDGTNVVNAAGDVYTTATQTLTNKTLTSPTIATPAVTGGTFTGGTFDTPTVNTPTITTPTVSGAATFGGAVTVNSTLDVTGALTVTGALSMGSLATPASATAYRTNDGTLPLASTSVWSAMAEVTLTDAATVEWNMGSGYDFVLTLEGNRYMNTPTNPKVGQKGRLRVSQGSSGSRTLSWSSVFKFANATAPTLSSTAGYVDVLTYDVVATNVIYIYAAGRRFG